jgi:hypothetical protein
MHINYVPTSNTYLISREVRHLIDQLAVRVLGRRGVGTGDVAGIRDCSDVNDHVYVEAMDNELALVPVREVSGGERTRAESRTYVVLQ